MTVITLAEIRYGIVRLPAGRKKQLLLDAAAEVFATFGDQILPVDVEAAELYAVIVSGRARAGQPVGATLATRNVSDLDGTGIEVINPWRQTAV